jgi:hypothetical protein
LNTYRNFFSNTNDKNVIFIIDVIYTT